MEQESRQTSLGRAMITLMIPIIIQNLINAIVNTADILMLSGVTQNALSASSLAGQVSTLVMICQSGLCVGVSILTAQYWGRHDMVVISKVQGTALRYMSIVAFTFFLGTLLVPEMLMRLYTNVDELIELGSVYLRVVSVSYLTMAFSQIMLSSMKSMEMTKQCARITIICLMCNITFNALSIYVFFPGNEKGALAGVAGATVLSRLVELTLCLIEVKRGRGTPFNLRHYLHTEKWLRHDYWKCSLPMLVNLLSWGGGTTMMSAIMGRMSSDIVAANSLAVTLRGLVTVGFTGMSAAGSILLGKALGQSNFSLAKTIGQKVFKWSIVLGFVASAILLLLKKPCLMVSSLEPEAEKLFGSMLLLNTLFCVGMAVNSSMVTGVFCAGGDTKFGLINDTITMWGVILPLGYLSAFVWHWAPLMVYFVFCMDELVKVPAVIWRFTRYKWLNNLTRTHKDEA